MPYSPNTKGENKTPIGVTRGTNAKLPHHSGLVPTYLMENEMLVVHHVVKR
jgi:hypothetical protein